MPAINFFSEDIDEFKPSKPRKTVSWIKAVVKKEKSSIKEVNFIFCSDGYLSQINKDYLNHSTLTDIITFDNREEKSGPLEGDIFISIPRVAENAQKFKVEFHDELDRVMIHGVLHLLGYSDKTTTAKSLMRKKEDTSLSLR